MTGRPHNNTNPRKFKEKIELLRQKEAQLTANFMEVMRGIPTLTRVSCTRDFRNQLYFQNVVPYSDCTNKRISPTGNMSPSPRMALDAIKSTGGCTGGTDVSGKFQFTLEANNCRTNRGLYNNSGGLDSGGGGGRGSTSNQISRTERKSADTQPRLSQNTQGRNRETSKARNWSRNQPGAELGNSGLVSQISPLRGPQSSPSSSVTYKPNLASVSPHSPSTSSSLPPTLSSSLQIPPAASQFYSSAEPPPFVNQQQQRQRFHPPVAPPLVPPPHSADNHTATAAYGWGDNPNPVDEESSGVPGGMTLTDYRRTYSDSCIPSSFSEPNRRFQQQGGTLQYQQQQHHVQNQGSSYPPPPHSSQPRLVQTLPPVNEVTFPRYQNAINNNTTPIVGGGSHFSGPGLSLSPRGRHQSSFTVSHQQQSHSWRKLQPDYHSMRNIPQRYAPLHHHNNHHHQMMPIFPQQQQQQLAMVDGMMMEGYEGYGGGQNGGWGVNANGFSTSVHDQPSSTNTSRLRKSDVYDQFRSKQLHQGQPLQPLSQMSSAMCIDNHNVTSSSSGSYYDSTTTVTVDPLTSYHHHQLPHHHPSSTSAGMCSTNGNVVPSTQPPLTQALDISVLDNDAFPSPEHEGRRDSFSMTVDLLSRLEKRPLDTSSCNSTASPPVISVASAWNSSFSPPPKIAKFDPSTAVAVSSTTPCPAFYVPIEEKDLQLLTEPSMVNYVTDAATEDQLVREQYSPS